MIDSNTNVDYSTFNNYPVELDDKVMLGLKHTDLLFMLNHLDWAKL